MAVQLSNALGSGRFIVPAFQPDVFKTINTTVGPTALWTPATGKRFRLLRYQIEVPGNCAISGGAAQVTISLLDSASAIGLIHTVWIPQTALTTMGLLAQWSVDLGATGILSAAVNNALNVTVSTTLTSGNVRFRSMGTEE